MQTGPRISGRPGDRIDQKQLGLAVEPVGLDHAKIAVNLLGGVEGQGFAQLMKELSWERLSTAHGAAINMERAV